MIPTDDIGAFVGIPSLLIDGAASGPLAGCTLGVKDLFDVAGTVTRAGNPDFALGRAPAERSATAVQRLVDAGADVVGRTVTDELAFSLSGTNVHDGTPVNVRAPGRVPGGSSAGSAAAVAAGLVDLALGTDTGGSVRVPASYCGIFGWRPTHGAVPIDGVVPLAPSFDTVGLFAAGASRLAAAAHVLLGDSGVGATPPPRLRLLHEVVADSAPDVDAAVGEAAWSLAARAGLELDHGELGIDVHHAFAAFRARQGFEAWAAHGTWITEAAPSLGPGISARFAAASQVTADDVADADRYRAVVADAVRRATDDGAVLVVPAAAGPAPSPNPDPGEHELVRARTLRLTCIAGLAGAPVVVLPLAQVDGLPVGVALIGAPGTDAALLDWVCDVA